MILDCFYYSVNLYWLGALKVNRPVWTLVHPLAAHLPGSSGHIVALPACMDSRFFLCCFPPRNNWWRGVCLCYHYIYNHSYITLTVSAFNPDVLHSLDFNVKICNLTINCVRCNFKKSSQSKTVFLLTASSRQERSGFNRSLKSVSMINTLLIDFQSQSFWII